MRREDWKRSNKTWTNLAKIRWTSEDTQMSLFIPCVRKWLLWHWNWIVIHGHDSLSGTIQYRCPINVKPWKFAEWCLITSITQKKGHSIYLKKFHKVQNILEPSHKYNAIFTSKYRTSGSFLWTTKIHIAKREFEIVSYGDIYRFIFVVRNYVKIMRILHKHERAAI